MKLSRHILFCIMISIMSGCLAQQPEAMITLHVIDQDGKPVENAEINASFSYGREAIRKKTDCHGFVSFCSPVLDFAVFSNAIYESVRNPEAHDKYYKNIFRYMYTSPSKNVKDGKWQPWNPTIEMVLKERIKPIPMYANERQHDEPIPARNQWCGFDMMKNAWVRPYGIGEHADVEIYHEWDGKQGKEYTGSTLKLRFPDKEAGCYMVQFDYDPMYYDVGFQSPYHAIPSKIDLKEVKFYEKYNPETGRFDYNLFQKGTIYVFRTRTRFDTQGRLVGAYYGKIYRPYVSIFNIWRGIPHIRLPFYLNPTENDTNLEFDPERNLLKNVRGYVDP